MKLVVRISNTDAAGTATSHDLAHALGELLREKHAVAVIHGRNSALLAAVPSLDIHAGASPQSLIASQIRDLELMAGAKLNKGFVATLGEMRIPAIGLFGSDGEIVRTRQKRDHRDNGDLTAASQIEIAAVEPFWLEVITSHGGVPVIANLALGPDRQYYCVDADQLAAACAIAWNADALIFLIREEGIRSSDGSVIRWVNSEQLGQLLQDPAIPPRLLSKLSACHFALSHGVRRARIFPIARSASLASFYFTRIDWGTEVILGSHEQVKAKSVSRLAH